MTFLSICIISCFCFFTLSISIVPDILFGTDVAMAVFLLCYHDLNFASNSILELFQIIWDTFLY